jgi:hypothetical protein
MPTGLEHSKYFTPEEIESRWVDYLKLCSKHVSYSASAGKVVEIPQPLIPTLNGFRMFIGISRSSWQEYSKAEGSYASYSDTIKKIKEFTEDAKVNALTNGQGSTTGLIFDLKVNYGWTEKQVVEQNVTYTANLGTTIIQPAPEASGNTSST